MSTVLPPVRGKTWIFQITALCIVLGMLLALSLKTQRQVLDEGVPGRMYVLKAEFRATKQENLDLRKELTQYRDRSDDLERKLSEGVRGTQSIGITGSSQSLGRACRGSWAGCHSHNP